MNDQDQTGHLGRSLTGAVASGLDTLSRHSRLSLVAVTWPTGDRRVTRAKLLVRPSLPLKAMVAELTAYCQDRTPATQCQARPAELVGVRPWPRAPGVMPGRGSGRPVR